MAERLAKVILAFLALVAAAIAQQMCTPSQTPQDIENNFLTNCQRAFTMSQCQTAWDGFTAAFVNQAPSDVEPDDYNSYFQAVPFTVGKDQTLFWSGTSMLVNVISTMCTCGVDIKASTNTPAAEIIGDLGSDTSHVDVNWCGANGAIDYQTECPCNPVAQFWRRFSQLFAQAASGTVFYAGYGERTTGTYNRAGFFASAEIPNLSQDRVSTVVAIVFHRKGEGESCGNGTLSDLEEDVSGRNFEYKCYEVFGDIMDASMTQALADCAGRIIIAEQQGNEPEADPCFSIYSGSQGLMTAKIGVLLIATLLLSLVFCLNTE